LQQNKINHFIFLFVINKNESEIAIKAKLPKTNIGNGFGISATIGANMVNILAKMLLIPRTVEAKTAGYNIELAKKSRLNVPPKPNLASKTTKAMMSVSSVYRNKNKTEPANDIDNKIIKENFRPTRSKRKQLKQAAIKSPHVAM
jgi:uncharacterized protein YxjI